MNKKILPVLLMSLLAACSSGKYSERTDYGNDASRVAALEVPPDLVAPQAGDHYTVPGAQQSESYSDYVKATTDASAMPATPPTWKSLPDGSKDILLNETFGRCWLRVEQALDGAGIAVEDKDRSKGLFYLKGGHNQVTLQANASACEVAVNDGSGKSTDETGHIMDALFQNLSK